ncbi:hypothetical protein D6764_03630 [Candidatus Woesearchaeota archaeon]|nr:MAG: hypothetical protein D6764_03630 [Candidatus Woesearchaeota archaeon]
MFIYPVLSRAFMRVFIERQSKWLDLDFSGPAIDLVKKLNLNIEEVIISRNNEIVTEDTVLSNGDTVKLLSVLSGG